MDFTSGLHIYSKTDPSRARRCQSVGGPHGVNAALKYRRASMIGEGVNMTRVGFVKDRTPDRCFPGTGSCVAIPATDTPQNWTCASSSGSRVVYLGAKVHLASSPATIDIKLTETISLSTPPLVHPIAERVPWKSYPCYLAKLRSELVASVHAATGTSLADNDLSTEDRCRDHVHVWET